jgi:uncharacterized protein YbjT (DUF2867 family)
MKNYVITGSIGHISKPIVAGLVKAGKNVSVVTSDQGKVGEIEKLGARALVGTLNDLDFVTKSFEDADVVYTMIPPIWQTDNWRKSQAKIAEHFIKAIEANNIKYVVNLSSVGAHLPAGTGPVSALYEFEQQLNKVPGLNVKHLRPSFFFYNLINQIGLIRHANIMGANYGGGDQKIALVHTSDIAAAALEELSTLNFKGNSVRYIVSDERSGEEIVKVLGSAIKKEIPWVQFSDEDQLKGLLDGGVPPTHAAAFVEMGASFRTGKMQEDLLQKKPAFMPTKLEDFAKEFASAFEANSN